MRILWSQEPCSIIIMVIFVLLLVLAGMLVAFVADSGTLSHPSDPLRTSCRRHIHQFSRTQDSSQLTSIIFVILFTVCTDDGPQHRCACRCQLQHSHGRHQHPVCVVILHRGQTLTQLCPRCLPQRHHDQRQYITTAAAEPDVQEACVSFFGDNM